MNRSNSVVCYETEIKNLREKITSIEFNKEIDKKESQNEILEKNSQIEEMRQLLTQKIEKITQLEKTLKNNRNFELIREMQEKLEQGEKKIINYEKQINLLEKKLNQGKKIANEKVSKLKNILKQGKSVELIKQTNFLKSEQNTNLKAFFEIMTKEKQSYVDDDNISLVSNPSDSNNIKNQRRNSLKSDKIENQKILKRRSSVNHFINESVNILDNLKNINRKNSNNFDKNMELNLFPIEENLKNSENIDYDQIIENLQKIILEEEQIKIEFEKIINKKTEENNKLYFSIQTLEKDMLETEEFKENILRELDDTKHQLNERNKKIIKIQKLNEILESDNLIKKNEIYDFEVKLKIYEKEKMDLQNIILKKKSLFQTNSVIFEEQAILLQNHNKEKDKNISEIQSKFAHLLKKNKHYEKLIENYENEKYELNNNYNDNLKNMEQNYLIEISNLQKIITDLKINQIKGNKKNFVSLNVVEENHDNLDGLELGVNEFDDENDLKSDNMDFSIEDLSEEEEEVRKRIKTIVNPNSILPKKSNFSDSTQENKQKHYFGELEELEKQIEELNDKNLCLIEKIESKESEIQKLRKMCIDQDENNKFISVEDYNNEVNLLKMDIEHLKKNLETSENNSKKKEKNHIKEFKEMINNCLSAKLKQNEILSEMDSLRMSSYREIRNLKYQIQLYEKEIENFNNNMHKK